MTQSRASFLRRWTARSVFSLLLAFSFCHIGSAQLDKEYWYQWRGPDSNGVAPQATPPLEWSEDNNLQWKVEIEGAGSSVPIIFDDKVFVLTCIDTGEVDPSLPAPEDQPDRVFGIKFPNTLHRFVVLCLDRETGDELWQQTASELIPHEGHHGDNDFASASPVTDGNRLFCWFGSAGLYCYTLDGDKIWERDLGQVHMGASLGEGTSPVLHDGRLIVVRDHSRQSYIEVLDARTGDTIWKKDRNEPNSWATPVIAQHDGVTQVITSGTEFVRSYDLDSGDIVWQASGLTSNPIPCPVLEDNSVICMTGYEGFSALSIAIDQTGDVSDSDAIRWSVDRGTSYIPSPLNYNGMLYFLQSNQAVLSCLDAKTGETIIERTRLPEISNVYASPVGANGHVYITGRDGTTLVLRRTTELDIVASNSLDDRIDTSLAIAGDQIFIRGNRFLYCISERESEN